MAVVDAILCCWIKRRHFLVSEFLPFCIMGKRSLYIETWAGSSALSNSTNIAHTILFALLEGTQIMGVKGTFGISSVIDSHRCNPNAGFATQGLVSLQRSNAVAVLRCHWPKVLRRRRSTVVIHGPGRPQAPRTLMIAKSIHVWCIHAAKLAMYSVSLIPGQIRCPRHGNNPRDSTGSAYIIDTDRLLGGLVY